MAFAPYPTSEAVLMLLQATVLLVLSLCFGWGPKLLALRALADGWQQLKQTFAGAGRCCGADARLATGCAAASSPASVLACGVGRLPAITRGELARLLRLSDLASLATTQRSFQASLWDCANVWHVLAAHRGLPSIVSAPEGWEARRRFRHVLFRLDGSKLRRLPCTKHQEVLEEAARMVRGLLPEDFDDAASGSGADTDLLFSRAEMVLGDVDPENAAATGTAQVFLKAVREAITVIGEFKVEKLEHAYSSAQELHKMMMSAMKTHLHCQIQNMENRFWQDAPSSLKPLRACSGAVHGPGPLERKRLRKEKEAAMAEVSVSPLSSASTQSPPQSPQAGGRVRSFSGMSGSF